MKLSRLYSNKPQIFEPINFQPGLNVVIGEIRLPENRKHDTHNLGKTILGRLLDFLFLGGREADFFLFKHKELFFSFIFCLELQLEDSAFLTIRRSVEEASKISFKRHSKGGKDFLDLPQHQWDHFNIPHEKAKKLLDGFLDWKELTPWTYRKMIGYLLRTQGDYQEVFQLRKFSGKHSDWKPFLAHLLGFNGNLVEQSYEKEKNLESKQKDVQIMERKFGDRVKDASRIEGILVLKRDAAEKKQLQLNAFDFSSADREQTKRLVDDLDVSIANLNSERYLLTYNQRTISDSLAEDQILFNPEEAQRIFQEAHIYFEGQIKRDFEQLIAFNRAITEERSKYLKEELAQIEERLSKVDEELNTLGKERSTALEYLGTTDIFEKYKQTSNSLISLKADIEVLESQLKDADSLQDLKKEVQRLTAEKAQLKFLVEEDVRRQVSSQTGQFAKIRFFFNEIIEEVIDRKALLNVSCNKSGHLDFHAEILDENGNLTSASDGHTYQKLLCIAYDLAILRAYSDIKFARFVFHDGIFETLELRKRGNLLAVLRQYADLGLQLVITLTDSDSPPITGDKKEVFDSKEVILKLHDEGESGLLFKIKPW